MCPEIGKAASLRGQHGIVVVEQRASSGVCMITVLLLLLELPQASHGEDV